MHYDSPAPGRDGRLYMRFGWLLGLVGVATLWGGSQEVYTAATNGSPTSLTLAEYVAERPAAKWLELHNAVVFLPDAAHFYKTGREDAPATELFIPLHVEVPEDYDAPAPVLLATKDAHLLALYNGMGSIESQEEFDAFIEEHGDAFLAPRTVSGVVRYGINLKDKEYRQLLDVAQSDGFIILEDGERPSWGFGLGMLLLGVGAFTVVGRGWRRRRVEAAGPTADDRSGETVRE
jgi:hypothetical protein